MSTPQERNAVNDFEKYHYDMRLNELSETVERLESAVDNLAGVVQRVVVVVEALEGFAEAWTKASGGAWVVKKVLTCLIWVAGAAAALGAGTAGYKQIMDQLLK